MVVFLDLDEDDVSDPDPHADPSGSAGYEWAMRQRVAKPRDVTADHHAGTGTKPITSDDEIRDNPNVNSLSAALGCYPYLTQCSLLQDDDFILI